MKFIYRGKISHISLFVMTLFLSILVVGCQNRKKRAMKQIDVSYEFIRFDEKFKDTINYPLEVLQERYPYLFHSSISDSVWEAKRTDELFDMVQQQVDRVFSETEELENQFIDLFKHIKFYFPERDIPRRVIGLTSEVDYQTKVVYLDTLAIIALDCFLGGNNEIYSGIHNYERNLMERDYLIPTVAKEFAKRIVEYSNSRSFISKMVYMGKIMYIVDLLLPDIQREFKLGYTYEQFRWAVEYEREVWRYLLENELLYSSDKALSRRFLENAPYSKFYLEIDQSSSPRIGVYMGYQIVKSYRSNFPSVTLAELIRFDEEELFILSNYKPPR